MFLSKKNRAVDKAILSKTKSDISSSDIHIKIDSKEMIYSQYSYSKDNLNKEFCDFLYSNSKKVTFVEKPTLILHSNEDLDADKIKESINNHFASDYKEVRKSIVRNSIVSAVMMLLGLIALALLFVVHRYLDNFFLTSIIEIGAWVFIWEAVDMFFLQRPVLKAECLCLQKLFLADIKIEKLEKVDSEIITEEK